MKFTQTFKLASPQTRFMETSTEALGNVKYNNMLARREFISTGESEI